LLGRQPDRFSAILQLLQQTNGRNQHGIAGIGRALPLLDAHLNLAVRGTPRARAAAQVLFGANCRWILIGGDSYKVSVVGDRPVHI
jgi:hypothetical protein